MKFTYSWLKEHIETDLSPEELAEILTRIGLEVDDHHPLGPSEEALEGLLVGKVEEVNAHPNADKLVLTKVDIGEGETLPIVCGAPNVEAGQKVVVAPPGTTVHPTGHEPFKIKKAKIRGEQSQGMICSAMEIGLGMDHDGIMVLDSSEKAGTPVKEVLKGQSDHLFEIDITPNRADALSVHGIARDLDAYLCVHEGKKLRKGLERIELPKGKEGGSAIGVTIEDEEACPRYCGLTIEGVEVKPSPEWLKEKLEAIGAQPINNVVDVTNYVLFELGQPLHAFDASKLGGRGIRVKKLPQGTRFTTLDEEERKLAGHELMICDAEDNGLCMAGILGGIDSGVKEGTTEIFLESAYFDPATVRRGASHHGLSTEASYRFERGVDPWMTRYALERAAKLILDLAGGEIVGEVEEEGKKKFEAAEVELPYEWVRKHVGEPLDQKELLSICEALEMEVTESDEEGCTVCVPPYRVDVTRKADLLEEILRIHGYDRIGTPERLRGSLSYSSGKKGELRRVLSDMLCGRGFYEISTNSLVHSERAEGWAEASRHVEVLNPISSELDVLRQQMLQSVLPVLSHNLKRKEEELRLLEFGKVYWKEGKGYDEEERLALFMCGRREPENWRNRKDALSFFDLKGEAMSVLERLGLAEQLEVDDELPSQYQEGVSYSEKGKKGRLVLECGRIKPELLDPWDIDRDIFVAELRFDRLYEAYMKKELRYQPLPKQLAVRKDMAFIVDRDKRFGELRDAAFKAEKKLLQEVDLFDVFEGDRIGKGKKSYAMKFSFLHPERTLKDKDLDGAMERIRKQLEAELGAVLRDG